MLKELRSHEEFYLEEVNFAIEDGEFILAVNTSCLLVGDMIGMRLDNLNPLRKAKSDESLLESYEELSGHIGGIDWDMSRVAYLQDITAERWNGDELVVPEESITLEMAQYASESVRKVKEYVIKGLIN
jgi:hypothetical protein